MQRVYLIYQGTDLYLVPYNDIKRIIFQEYINADEKGAKEDSETETSNAQRHGAFIANWHQARLAASAEFEEALEGCWREIFTAVDDRGAPPGIALSYSYTLSNRLMRTDF